MSEIIVKPWLSQRAHTAKNHQLQEHLNLISKNVKLYGIPDHPVVDYQAWASQCENEFSHKVLVDISYSDTQIISSNPSSIQFTTLEHINSNDGKKHQNQLKIIIQLEDDSIWRVVEEHVMSAKIIE